MDTKALKGLPNNLIIFCPAFGENVNAKTMISIAKVAHIMGCLDVNVIISSISFPDIATLRNSVFTAWMEGTIKASHLLWVDADMAFEPQLILDMLAWDVPFIGAIYPQKRYDPEDYTKKFWVVHSTNSPKRISEDMNYLEVDGLGFGCVLMRRDLGEKMIEAYPDLIVDDLEGDAMANILESMGCNRIINVFDLMREPSGKKVSEDYSFCRRWKAIDGEIWACADHELTHVGPHAWKGNFTKEVAINLR